MRRVVYREECDTVDEVQKLFQEVFNNAALQDTKLSQIADEVSALKPTKKPTKKGGFMLKKMLAFIVAIAVSLMVVSLTLGVYVTTDINYEIASNPEMLSQYLRDVFANVTSESYLFTPTTTANAPAHSEGKVFYDDTLNKLQLSTGTDWLPIDTAGGVSLDSAYDYGSVGGGRTITATDGAVQITNTENDTASLLGLTYSGNTTGDGLTITMSVGSGDAIEIENTGTGSDIEGTGGYFTLDKAGAIVCVGITNNAGDVLFDDTYDVAWDTSEDMLIFQDNAVLGIGGDHDGAADVTIKGDGTNVLIEAVSDNWGQVRIGSTNALDWAFYSSDAAKIALFDVSAAEFLLNGYDIRLSDDDMLTFGDSSASDSFVMDFDESTDNLIIVATTTNDAVQIGDGTTGTDLKMMGATSGDWAIFDASANELFFEDCDLKLNEGAQIEFAVADNSIDWTIDISTDETLLFLPSESDDTSTLNIGNATYTSDVRIFGRQASTVVYDASGDTLIFNAYDVRLQDSDILFFGDAEDVDITFDGTDFIIDANSADEGFKIGGTATGFDITYYFETAGTITTDYDGDVMAFSDQMGLVFGSNADASIMYDETTDDNLEILAASVGMSITTNDFLATLDGAAADQFKVDATGQIDGDAINLETTDGGIMLNADGSTYGDIELNAADDVIITAAGDLALTVTGDATFQGTWLPATVKKKTITTGAVTTADCGYCLQVSADAQTITLPATVAGVEFWIMCIAADDGALLTIELDNADKFVGSGFTPADGEAMTIPKTGQNYGDYIKVSAHTDGWIITEMVGTWAEATP